MPTGVWVLVLLLLCFLCAPAPAQIADDPVRFAHISAALRSRLNVAKNAGFAPKKTHFLSESAKAQIDDFVAAVQQCGKLPGLTLSITSRNATLHTATAGVKNVNDPTQLVDSNTLFSIGSTTKAFTTAALGILQDRGIVDWDSHELLRQKMPYLHLNNSFGDMDVTLRDLATHRTGIADPTLLLFAPPNMSRIEALENIVPLVLPELKFRYQYLYNNWMYSALGSFVDAATPATWEEFVQTEILDKLGMNSTCVSLSQALDSGNYASPHVQQQDSTFALPDTINECIEMTSPAGIIASSAVDMAKWIRLHLNKGTVPETQQPVVISPQTLAGLYAPVTAIDMSLGYVPNAYGNIADITMSYALGWVVSSYRGLRELYHTGGTIGHTSLVAFVPDAGVGMFTSINLKDGKSPEALELLKIFALDTALGVTPAVNATVACEILQGSTHTKPATQHTRNKPSVPLGITGAYHHPAWGTLTLFANGNVTLNRFTGSLQANPSGYSIVAQGVWEMIVGTQSPVAVIEPVGEDENGLLFTTQQATYFFSK